MQAPAVDLRLGGVRVRALKESDHGLVVPVVDEWWGGRRVADKLPRLFFRYFAGTSFAVEENGELIAFLVGIVGSSDEAYVHFVGAHPEHRSSGLGRRLYETFFEEARARGCRSVRSITSPVNRGSIAFHRRMGFEIVDGDAVRHAVAVHPDYGGDGKDKVVFRKDLS